MHLMLVRYVIVRLEMMFTLCFLVNSLGERLLEHGGYFCDGCVVP